MRKLIFILLALLSVIVPSQSATADIIVQDATAEWDQELNPDTPFLTVPSHIVLQYATSIYNDILIYPSELLLSSDSVPKRIATEYATSIFTGNLVPFNIKYLDVIFPGNGEVLNKGQEYFITWDFANITGNIQIDLYMDGTNVLQLAASAPNTGEYEFYIPDYLLGGSTYKIGISAENGQVWNFSSINFTITPFKCTVQSEISDAEMATGDAITYRICIENPEDAPLSDMQIINPIPNGALFRSATGPFTYLEPEQEVRWDIGTLEPGAITCVELTIDVTASAGGVISNTVNVNSGILVATMEPYHTAITESTKLNLEAIVDTSTSLSTPPELKFGVLELQGAVSFNEALPTYVISHGWNPFGKQDLPNWQINMADQIRVMPANVFTWNWLNEASGLVKPFFIEQQSAYNLYSQIEKEIIGIAPTYRGDIHLIGHSLGSGVVIYTARYFRDYQSTLYDNLTNLTLLDSPYWEILPPAGLFLWDSRDSLFVDNYTSWLGRMFYVEADVNVHLFEMDLLCLGTDTDWIIGHNPHGFAHEWYNGSISNFQNPPLLCDSNVPPEPVQYGFHWSTNRYVSDTLYYHEQGEPNWELHSKQDPINYILGQVEDTADWVQGQFVDVKGFIIDKKDALIDSAIKTKRKIEVLSMIAFEAPSSLANVVTDVADHSSWLAYTVADIAYQVLRLIHQSDSSVSIGMDIHSDANSLRFSFELPLADRGSVLEVFINDTLTMVIRCNDYVQKGWQTSEWIDVSNFAGQHVDLVFRMSNLVVSSKGVVHLDDIIVAKIIPSIDTDDDTFLDEEDNCPFDFNENQADEDFDGVGDACDVCLSIANPAQLDRDCDCDIDGADVAELISQSAIANIDDIASEFGRDDCY